MIPPKNQFDARRGIVGLLVSMTRNKIWFGEIVLSQGEVYIRGFQSTDDADWEKVLDHVYLTINDGRMSLSGIGHKQKREQLYFYPEGQVPITLANVPAVAKVLKARK